MTPASETEGSGPGVWASREYDDQWVRVNPESEAADAAAERAENLSSGQSGGSRANIRALHGSAGGSWSGLGFDGGRSNFLSPPAFADMGMLMRGEEPAVRHRQLMAASVSK